MVQTYTAGAHALLYLYSAALPIYDIVQRYVYSAAVYGRSAALLLYFTCIVQLYSYSAAILI